MLKYQCSKCGQQVVAAGEAQPGNSAARGSGVQAKCPRCGAVNDIAGTPQAGSRTQARAMVAALIDTEQEAAQRRAAEEEATAASREEQAEDEFRKRHEREEQLDRLATLGTASKPVEASSSSAGRLFVLGVVVFLIAAAAIGFFQTRRAGRVPKAENVFAPIEGGNVLEAQAQQWARRLFPDASYQVYAIQFDSASEPRGDLVMVRGVAIAGQGTLTQEQIAALVRKPETPSASEPSSELQATIPSPTAKRDQLKQDMQTFKDAYNPAKIDAVSSGKMERAQQPAATRKPDGTEELRALGYESPKVQAAEEASVLRLAFICVMQRGEAAMGAPGGAALDCFMWKTPDGQTSSEPAAGPDADAAIHTAESIFTTLHEGGSFHPFVHVDSAEEAERLFPSRYQPAAWKTVRCDRLRNGTLRVLVRVKDGNPDLSGTWVLDLLNVERDGRWLVRATFPPAP